MSEVVNSGAPAPAVDSSTPAAESQAQSVENSAESINAGGESAGQEQIDAIQDAVENGELSQAEANKLIKKFQLKVRGKVIEREIDLGDEDYLKNQFQLAEAAKLSMQEKAELEKRFEQILQSGKQDPMKFIQEAFGLDPDELEVSRSSRKRAYSRRTTPSS
jgi:Txe/YoeB family toxin of Txe-Axe toxin-antitoxin module